jgi:hypothetical protein
MYLASTILVKTLEALLCYNIKAIRIFTHIRLIVLKEATNNYFLVKLLLGTKVQ